ncbi:RNA12 domain containing protein [Amanita muscaria]
MQAFLFIDSVFPVRLARWDFRHWIALFREHHVLDSVHSRLQSVNTHGFRLVSVEPHRKDGGVFVHFQYQQDGSHSEPDKILSQVKLAFEKHGGFPSWIGSHHKGNIWLVRGTPWKEDMDRFASSMLRVSFEGPDVNEQSLFQTFRPFGRIRDIAAPAAVPPGMQRSSIITYERLKSAVIARNVLYGLETSFDAQSASRTRLRPDYQKPLRASVARSWISGHPKISFPLIFFLLGTITYAIFDPIRSLTIQGKLLHWFDYGDFNVSKWLRKFERLPSMLAADEEVPGVEVWKERKDAEALLRAYLSEMPTTAAFVYGPQGSGKFRMTEAVIRQVGRDALFIDCSQLIQASSDAQLIGALASQTGYRPVFTFFNSVSTLIDLASVGLIGQKAGLSSSLQDQLRHILQTTTVALERVAARHRARIEKKLRLLKQRKTKRSDSEKDPILAGLSDHGVTLATSQNVDALPVVVIRHFSTRVGLHGEDVPGILAQWAAQLVENQIAHVVMISDNRENAKQAAKALPTKPLHVIQLSDADAASSLLFVKQKLHDLGLNVEFTSEQTVCIERLGGRASDLESLIHKVRAGQRVEDAVEEIIDRGVSELRKNAFGDDEEDSKRLPWTREQAWRVVRLLSRQSEVPYYDVLLDVPFKGEESPLRAMEHAEVISIGMLNGRPSTIKPGKPVLRWAFERLVSDPIFAATQDISYNSKLISNFEKTIKNCEDELTTIKPITVTGSSGWIFSYGDNLQARASYLASKIQPTQKKIEALEKANKDLRAILSKGDKQ